MKEYKSNEELINYLLSKGVVISNKKDALEKVERYTYYSIVNTYKNIFKDKNGNYIENVSFDDIYALFEFDKNLKNDIKENLLKKINNEIEKDYNVHTAVTHYIDKYGFVPPFVLVKILTFGVASIYYGLLKQSDRQAIAKYFKISDKLLKQILKNFI